MACQSSGQIDKEVTETTRLPRWSVRETLVLIEGKRVADITVKSGQKCSSNHLELKWDLVSSYCKRHGVERISVECSKKWENVHVDFRKIKRWEESVRTKEEVESFSTMRNDTRKAKRLSVSFERKVYDVLDGTTTYQPALTTIPPDFHSPKGNEVEKEQHETVCGNAQLEHSKQKGKETMVQDSPGDKVTTPAPGLEKQTHPFCEGCSGQGRMNENPTDSSTRKEYVLQEAQKWRRTSLDTSEPVNWDRFIRVLERNSNMLNIQLEAQNRNFQLDRDQQKEHHQNLGSALSNLTHALTRIEEKL
ncbi:hypothetical protein UlMin_027967 [Ulmus minor]